MEEKIKNKILKSFKSSLDCYQIALYSMCKRKYNKSVILISAINWGMNCNQDTGVLWKDIRITESDPITYILKEWYGIDAMRHSLAGKAAIEKIHQGLANQQELVIQMDGFDCSSNTAYQKHHLPHSLIIYNYSQEENVFQYYDPFYDENLNYEISPEVVEKSIYAVTEIRNMSEEKTLALSDIYTVLSHSYGGTIEEIEQCYRNIKKRLEQIKEIDDLFYGEEEPDLSDLILKFKNISNIRCAISGLLLTYGYSENEDMFNLAEAFYELSKIWKTINVRFMQMNLKHSVDYIKVFEKLEEAKQLEISIMEELLKHKK